MLSQLTQLMSQPSIAVDLGTANTRIYASLHGEVTERPSAIRLADQHATDTLDEYLQYTNNKLAAKPLRGGVIVDLKNAVTLLRPLVKKSRRFFLQPITLASAPSDTTEKERDLLRKALLDAGAAHVSIIPEVWAAAIGAGLDVTHPQAQVLIDIGDGVTDMAVFRDGRMMYSSSIRLACSDIQRSIRSAIMAKYTIQLFDDDVERLTDEISAILEKPHDESQSLPLPAMDVVKRRRVDCAVEKRDIANAIEPVVNKITAMIETSLKRLPERIYCEILESGIWLTGGGACMAGMDRLIAQRTGMAVRIAPDPLHAVIHGAIQTLNFWTGKKCWWENIVWPSLSH